MNTTQLKRFAPLLVIIGYIIYHEISASGDSSDDGAINTGVLGSRTMSAMQDFVTKLQPIAEQLERETGISAVLGMAEASEESAWGASGLAVKANNLFGFTAELGTYWRTQNLPYVEMPTHEWVKQPSGSMKVISGPNADGVYYVEMTRPFRSYPSWEASYRDWARLMQTKRYVDAGALAALKAGDAAAFGAALNKAGYATDPNYGTKVAQRAATIEDQIA